MTAADFEPFADHARAAKLDEYVAKPFTVEALRQAVAAAIKRAPLDAARTDSRMGDAAADRSPSRGGVQNARGPRAATWGLRETIVNRGGHRPRCVRDAGAHAA